MRPLCAHVEPLNYFVAIESGLAGGKFLLGDGKMSAGVAFLGMVLSFIWYVMGAEDRYLVRVYRKQVADAGALVASSLCNGEGEEYRYVGEIRESSKGIAPELSGWRLEAVSTTKLASLVPTPAHPGVDRGADPRVPVATLGFAAPASTPRGP